MPVARGALLSLSTMLEPVLTRAVSKRLRPRHERVKAIVVGRAATGVANHDDFRRVLALVSNSDAGHEEAG